MFTEIPLLAWQAILALWIVREIFKKCLNFGSPSATAVPGAPEIVFHAPKLVWDASRQDKSA